MRIPTAGSGLAGGLINEIREVAAGAPVAVAFSGGLDSSVVAALARDALGPANVLLVTVNMGQYAYRRGNAIVLEMAEQLGLQQRCLLGQARQHAVQRGGPACNRCTREIKLGMVKAAAQGRPVLTGSNRSDTWGQRGLRIHDGYYSPLLDLDKPQIREMAGDLGLEIPRIGEHWGREGCKLKHLLKPLINPDYHGRAVAEANEALLEVLAGMGFDAELANVKIVGPLRRNVGLVNVRPEPPSALRAAVLRALGNLAGLDEVRFVEGPVRLVVKAGPALAGDAAGRYWVEHGRLAPDFAHPIEAEWRPSPDGRLHTFHVLDAVPL
ncbi:MAG: ExsB family protein [Armatimonadetes bacterium]|nr:ExsB family protein [Armatimonadota bacterium]